MREVPDRLLDYSKVTVEFHAGRAFDAGRHEKEGRLPDPQPKIGAVHRRTGQDAKMLAADKTPEQPGMAEHVTGRIPSWVLEARSPFH